MNKEHRIRPVDTQFILIGDAGEQVDASTTADLANQDIERCIKDDAMWETAILLVDIAIKTLMQMHGVDRKTARHWISRATDAV